MNITETHAICKINIITVLDDIMVQMITSHTEKAYFSLYMYYE
jgi:hypothetical protein